MASSSTSSVSKSFKYDVFLSFRGEDTRKNFIDHLYYALQQSGISTYKDDERIEKGKRISDELMGSIEDSKFFIVVFSKNYASSSWCLNELLKIMECHKTTEHAIYPVFYDVEPTEVRKQTGAVGEAFARHEKEEAAGEWRKALKEAADVAGWELKNTADGHEAKSIRLIVEKLSLELRNINVCIDENLVGMETRIKDILSSLETASDDVRMIGIWGIGGGGKTTLARALFDQISFQFEGKSFVENVREVSNLPQSGLKSLQRQILSNVLKKDDINVDSVSEGKNMMQRMMRDKKVLLVLDDVDHGDQLEALAGDPSWFKAGSIIIITTRDEQVLLAHRVKLICSIALLSDKEAMRLFSRYAFGREIPVQGYEKLSRQVVSYAAGLPLTIKVLGSFLCGKNKPEWVDALTRLKTIPLEETQKKLELSYIGLDDEYKEIFLDVATILKGLKKDTIIQALESRGFHAIIGLRVLQQKALITFYDNNDGFECVGMHDHLEEMGRNIVRLSHSNKHSRLWDSKETEDILAGNLGTEATKCIKFFIERLDLKVFLNGLRKMKELSYLHVSLRTTDPHPVNNIFIPTSQTLRFMCCNWKYNEVIPYFPESLRYLIWSGYPFRYLPKTFQANNLVGLHMVYNNLVQLWEGGSRKVLYKLRFLTLTGRNLRAFDLRLAPNLEKLTLFGYGELVEFYMPVECLKLRYLKLMGVKLGTFDIGLTPNLEYLYLYETDLVELHMPLRSLNLRSLRLLRNLELRTVDIGLTRKLKALNVRFCDNLEELHMPDECVNLKSLFLRGLKLRTLNLAPCPNLERLNLLQCNDLEEFHIAKCPILTNIKITKLKLRTLDLRMVPNLCSFYSDCKGLVELHLPGSCLNLKTLTVRDSKLRTLNIGLAPILTRLKFNNCCDLEELHLVDQCQKLQSLDGSRSKLRTLDLGLTPNLKELYLKGSDLVELHAPMGCLKNILRLNLSGCLGFSLFTFSFPKNVDTSSTEESPDVGFIARLRVTLKSCPFHPDNNFPKFKFRCFHKENIPSLTRNIEKLISGGPCVCTKFESFSRSIRRLKRKRKLKLQGIV